MHPPSRCQISSAFEARARSAHGREVHDLAQQRPARSGISHTRLGTCLHRRAARLPIVDAGYLTRALALVAFTNERQADPAAQVVGKLFKNGIGHRVPDLQRVTQMGIKSLI